jgi:hypothetical protein
MTQGTAPPAESISDVKPPTPTNARKSLLRNPTVIAAIITSVSAIVIALFSLVPKDKPKQVFVCWFSRKRREGAFR